MKDPGSKYYHELKSIDELLERDRRREEDGFPRKIKLGRVFRPGKEGKNRIVVVPTTVEEKLYHDEIRIRNKDGSGESSGDESTGGTGQGQEGDVIGETPIHQEQGAGTGGGEGDGEGHDIAANSYDLGKILTEKFELPNLKDKGKKKTFTKYKYDLTDKNRGFGQFLDKKATLRRIVQTNRALGRLPDPGNPDSTKFLVDPQDLIYRILSREKDYESQALVFFLRDYSASMYGKATEIVTSQHLMIYSWLTYQYENQVESRFILHDTDAKEVPDFYTYYNLSIAGGTFVAAAYKLVNKLVEEENLARDYNVYIFHGTDGDDSDTEGKAAIEELKKMMLYASRVGISVVSHSWSRNRKTAVQEYVEKSSLLKSHRNLIRLSLMEEGVDEGGIIKSIKELTDQS
ncbi:MAG: DUF444 family protein [Okeania sp. SIO3B3]|nr:DUF444 family protein [Okeania sp. SIO3B3]